MSTITLSQIPPSVDLFLIPTSDYSCGLTRVPAGAGNYLVVDDPVASPNYDIDYVYSNSVSSASDIYNVTGHTTETGVINYITVITLARSNLVPQSQSGNYQHKIMAGTGTLVSGNYAPLTTTWTTYSTIVPVSPATGLAWTWAEIDMLKAGIIVTSPVTTTIMNDIIRPSGAGALNASYRYLNSVFQGTGDATNYLYVDELMPDGNVTYLENSADYVQSIDTYIHPSLSSYTGVINYLQLFATIQSAHSNMGGFRHITRLGGTNYYGTQYAVPANIWTEVSMNWALCPSTSAAWTWANINAMEMGFCLGLDGYNWMDLCTQLYGVVNHTEIFSPEIRMTQCYVIVNYVPTPVPVTLLAPNEVNFSNTRMTERFIFPDGTYCISDYGREGKTMSLIGTETTNAIQNMRNMVVMANYNAPVTISGLMDVNQDTTWRMKSFNYDYDPSGDHFDWKASFEAI